MRRLSFLLIVSMSLGSLQAQNTLEWGLNALAGFPQGDFKSETDDSSFGFEASLGIGSKYLPVTFGVSAGYYNLGEATYVAPTDTGDQTNKADHQITQIDSSVESAQFQVFFKIHKDYKYMEPYFEVMAGYQHVSVETLVESTNFAQERLREKLDGGSASAGLGGGVAYFLHRQPETRKGSIQLVLGARYTVGLEYDFLKPETLVHIDDDWQYSIEQKNIALFHVRAGLHFIF